MTPDPKLDALRLVPRRLPPEALLSKDAREHVEKLAREPATCPGPGMLHPGFADTSGHDASRPAPGDVALTLVAFLASFASGAICHAFGGWPAALAVWSASAGVAAWAVRRAVRGARP